MGIFCSLFYAPWFLRSPLASAAPYFDLKAIEEMRSARAFMTDEAEVALASMERHLDFLSPPLVVMALADKFTPSSEKEALADALLGYLTEHDIDEDFLPLPSGKIAVPGPKFCTLDKFWPGDSAPSLASFVGKESLLIFHYLGLLDLQGLAWLAAPLVTWPEYAEFKKFESFVTNLSVVNDSAERSVKLMQDCMQENMTDEAGLQNKFVAVTNSRKRLPSTRKGVIKKSTFKSV